MRVPTGSPGAAKCSSARWLAVAPGLGRGAVALGRVPNATSPRRTSGRRAFSKSQISFLLRIRGMGAKCGSRSSVKGTRGSAGTSADPAVVVETSEDALNVQRARRRKVCIRGRDYRVDGQGNIGQDSAAGRALANSTLRKADTMFKIQALNKIASVGLDELPGDSFEIASENPDGILVRSADMHALDLPASVKAIARAGAGVNNIPIDKCSKRGVVVFNTPGANANSVKELVIAAMLLASRRIIPGVEWTRGLKGKGKEVGPLVEKGKNDFVGPEIKGKKLGVIGLGAIGVMVANDALALGMDVMGYDPYISVEAAWGLARTVRRATSLDQLLAQSD